MRIILWTGLLFVASTISASAAVSPVPEIDAYAGLAAMGLMGSVATLLWERRRRKK
jgi:hypothetical protein